ncbi:hypothetical protein OJ998_14770 [Solirubrobacter taibaiensis]|nr:hypothetical protein [Solirubrobacter taibaiensis]
MLRALLLALVALLIVVPSANAAYADRFVPFVDVSDDVHVGTARGEMYVRFGPKAAKLYRKLAGRTYTSGCIADPPGGEGTSGDLPGDRAPRKRSRLYISGLPGADVCFIASPMRASDDRCLFARVPDFVPGEAPQCLRAIVAMSDQGRAYVDAYARTMEIATIIFDEDPLSFAELQKDLGSDVVALAGPDDAPPPGTVGHFDNGHTRVISALLADGTRKFARMDGDVYSSNVPALYGDWDLLTLF